MGASERRRSSLTVCATSTPGRHGSSTITSGGSPGAASSAASTVSASLTVARVHPALQQRPDARPDHRVLVDDHDPHYVGQHTPVRSAAVPPEG